MRLPDLQVAISHAVWYTDVKEGSIVAEILVVEDDDDMQHCLAALLGTGAYACRVFRTAEDALAACRSWQPDLAVLDIMLPGKSGTDLARELHGRYPKMPILLVSALLSKWDPNDIADCRADAALPKPVEVMTLLDTVKHLIDGNAGD